MRYIFLPILAIGYLYWCYWSIKELIRVKWKIEPYNWSEPCHSLAVMWVFVHIAMALMTIGILILENW